MNQLSPDVFCVLLRLYKFYVESGEGNREASISFSDFEREILFDIPPDQANRVWTELKTWDLVQRFYKENVVELNVTKIRQDNSEFVNSKVKVKKRRFWLRITGAQLVREKPTIKPEVSQYVSRFVSKYPPKLQDKINKLAEGVVEFYLRKDKTVQIQDVSRALMILVEETDSDKMTEKVCDIYNGNPQAYGKFHPNYIRGICKNLKQNKQHKSIITLSKEETKQKFEESEKQFAIRIALGKAENITAYKAHIELKNFDGLRKRYKVGVEQLKLQSRENEIYKDYDWLKV